MTLVVASCACLSYSVLQDVDAGSCYRRCLLIYISCRLNDCGAGSAIDVGVDPCGTKRVVLRLPNLCDGAWPNGGVATLEVVSIIFEITNTPSFAVKPNLASFAVKPKRPGLRVANTPVDGLWKPEINT